MSNQKFPFPWLFSKPNLSHTNSQYLSHSHKALTFFTLRTLLDSKRSWNQIISRHHAIIHAFETNWAFRKPSTKMQNAYTRKTAYTFFVFYNWSTKKTEPNRRFFSKPNQNQTWKIHSAHPYSWTLTLVTFVEFFATYCSWVRDRRMERQHWETDSND